MQLQDAFAGVEHSAEMLAEPACDVLDLDLGHQVQVELGTQPRQRLGQDLGALVWRLVVVELVGDLGVDEFRQRRQVAGRLVGEPAADDDGLQIDVEPGRDERLVAGCDNNELVDELVVGATPAADLLAQCALLSLGHRLDDQHFEVRLIALRDGLVLELTWVGPEHVVFVQPGVLDITGAVPLGRERAIDPRDGVGELVVAARREQPLHAGELRRARVGPVRFQRCQRGEQVSADRDVLFLELAVRGRLGESVGRLLQPAPGVASQLPDTVVRTRIIAHSRPFRQGKRGRVATTGRRAAGECCAAIG